MARYTCKNEHGFTLIEIAIVIIIMGIIISVAATILPSLLRTGKIRHAKGILEKYDYTVEGYLISNGRCPCPDTDGDGLENRTVGTPSPSGDSCDDLVGTLPYATLGLPSGNDNWVNSVRYAVNPSLITTQATTFCSALALLSAGTGTLDPAAPYTTDGSVSTNMAWILASGGPKDLDGAGGRFDGRNGNATPLAFEVQEKIVDAGYDDITRSASFAYLSGRDCTGGGTGTGTGGTGGCTDVESVYCGTCDDGIDNDSTNGTDCSDPACATYPECVNPVCSIVTGADLGNGTINSAFSATLSASSGCVGSLTWSVVDNDGFSRLTVHPYTGHLSGTLNQCPGTYNGIRIQLQDSDGASETTAFSVTVDADLSVVRTDGDTSVNITWDNSDYTPTFQALGGHLQDIGWTLSSGGASGLSVVSTGEDTCRIVSDGSTLAGNYTVELTARDQGCTSDNTESLLLYITVPADLTPSWTTFDLEAVWHFDECTLWDGTPDEVKDSGGGSTPFHGVSNGVLNTGTGRICRAGVFDPAKRTYITMGDILDGLKAGSAGFTIAAWVYPYSLSTSSIQPYSQTNHGTKNCFLANASDANNDNFEIGVNENGTVHLYIDTVSKDTAADFGNSGDIELNQWHFVAAVYHYDASAPNDTTVTVYINDKAYQNTTAWHGSGGLDSANGSPFTIGASQHVDNYFSGKIDEVMAFTRSLDSAEVDSLYKRGTADLGCSGECYAQPVAFYKMEGDSWTGTPEEVVDEGTGQSHGVAAFRGSGNYPSRTAASGGKEDLCRAGVFSGINSLNGGFLDMGDPPDGDLDPGTDMWTVSTWFNWDGTSGDNILYNKENLYEARVNNGTVQYAWEPHWFWDGGSSFAVAQDTWAHLTIVYDGYQQMMYKNGEPVFVRSQSGAITSNGSKLLIGARGSSTPRDFFGGMLDHFKMYNRALSENEIRSDYTETMASCPADMVAIKTTSPLVPEGTINGPYSTTLQASGGEGNYDWEMVNPNPVSGLLIDRLSGVLHGTIDVCSGSYYIDILVTDTGGTTDQRTFELVVNNDTLTVSPASPKTLSCNTNGFYRDFTVSGSLAGELENWQIIWSGTALAGFEVISTGARTARFRKSGATVGLGGRFKLTAVDSGCPDNMIDTGYYTLEVEASGTGEPYYAGLVADYWLDELSGTAVDDHSGNSNDGTIVSDVTTGVQGKVWTAFEFDGTNEYIDVPDSSSLDVTGGITLAAWIKPQLAGDDSHRRIILKPASGSWAAPYYVYSLWVNDSASGGELAFGVSDGTSRTWASRGTLLDNTWQHVAGTYDGSAFRWYIDGEEVGSMTTSPTIAASDQNLRIGSAYQASHQFQGAIDEVKIFNRALSQDDIKSLFYEASLVASYHLDETSGTLYDSSGQANHGTNNGATYGVPGKLNTALYFDSDDYVDIGDNPILTPENISISVWANASALGRWNGILTNKRNAHDGINLQMGTSQKIAALVGNGTTYSYISSTTIPVTGTWYHIVVTHNSSDNMNILYINGVPEASGVMGLQYSLPVNTRISRFYSNALPFNGAIDELKIYNRVLNQSDVTTLFNQGK